MTEREYYGKIASDVFWTTPGSATEALQAAAMAVRNAPAYVDPVEEIANRMKGIANEQSVSPYVHEKYRAMAALAISLGAKL